MSAAADVAAKAKGKSIAGGAFMICCPARGHDDKTPSCKVYDGPDGRAMFHCFGGCDFRAVRAGAEARGLIPAYQNGGAGAPPPSCAQRDIIEEARRQREVSEQQERERKRRWAVKLWKGSEPISDIGGRVVSRTLAEKYLSSRGIKPTYPDCLRFAVRLKHPVLNHVGPALVSAFSTDDTLPVAVHLTFIKSDGSSKADLTPAKVIIGPANGSAVRLLDPRGALCVAEGLENGLSVQKATGMPTWAAMNAPLLGNLILPPIEQGPNLYIASDPDRAGETAADKLAKRAKQDGWKVHRVPAPDGLDWNDVLREAAQ